MDYCGNEPNGEHCTPHDGGHNSVYFDSFHSPSWLLYGAKNILGGVTLNRPPLLHNNLREIRPQTQPHKALRRDIEDIIHNILRLLIEQVRHAINRPDNHVEPEEHIVEHFIRPAHKRHINEPKQQNKEEETQRTPRLLGKRPFLAEVAREEHAEVQEHSEHERAEMHGVFARGIRQTHHEYENHERRGNEPIVVAHLVDFQVVQDAVGQIDLLDELGIKVSRDNGNAGFEIHDVSDGRVGRAERLDERDGTGRNEEDVGDVKCHAHGSE